MLDFHTKEGSRQNWKQLHQFDLYLDEQDRPVCQTQDGLLRPLIPEETDLFLREVVAHTEDYTVVIFEKGEGRTKHE